MRLWWQRWARRPRARLREKVLIGLLVAQLVEAPPVRAYRLVAMFGQAEHLPLALGELEEWGYVEGQWIEDGPQRARGYRLTASGRRHAERVAREWLRGRPYADFG